MGKMSICIDFDGVIHDYMEGWNGGDIYGRAVDGFIEWADIAREHFILVIYSSRSKAEDGIAAMRVWLHKQIEEAYQGNSGLAISISDFEFASQKPVAWLTIDDRAVRFDGDWSDPALSVEGIKAFKPWNTP